jgi:hypothetical protein
MPLYLLSFSNKGQFLYVGDHECDDDREAVNLAKEFSKDFAVEVRQGERVVARIKVDRAAAET